MYNFQPVKITEHGLKKKFDFFKHRKTVRTLRKRLGREPDLEETANEIGISVEEVNAREAIFNTKNNITEDGFDRFLVNLCSPEDLVIKKEKENYLHTLLEDILTEDEISRH